jgi:hypothetical protein
MIVLDDQLSAPYLKSEIEKWYAGSVVVLGSLRPHKYYQRRQHSRLTAGTQTTDFHHDQLRRFLAKGRGSSQLLCYLFQFAKRTGPRDPGKFADDPKPSGVES